MDDAAAAGASSPSCAGCGQRFIAGDLVMRARHSAIFHSSCFSCCVCRRPVRRGQPFALADRRIYCRADFERRRRPVEADAAATYRWACGFTALSTQIIGYVAPLKE